MLSNRGSAKLSFVVTFLLIFLVCGIYCFFMFEETWPLKSKKSSNTKTDSSKTTINYETELANATRNYVNDYYKDINMGERLIIKLSTLRERSYITLNDCRGYSVVKKGSTLEVQPFVKCSNYTSSNYNVDYE